MDDLESSRLLLEAGKYRNSVTLSYYAMFSIARALLLKKGLTPKTHDGVITLIGEKYVLDEGFDRELASDSLGREQLEKMQVMQIMMILI